MVGVETSGVKAAATRVWDRLFTRRRVVVSATPAVPEVAPVEPAADSTAIAVTPVAVTADADDADPAALKSAALEGLGASRPARASSDVELDAAAPAQVAVDAAEVSEEDAAARKVPAGMRAAVGVAAQAQPAAPRVTVNDLFKLDQARLKAQFDAHDYECSFIKAAIGIATDKSSMHNLLQRWANHLHPPVGERPIVVSILCSLSLQDLRQLALNRLNRFEVSLNLAKKDVLVATDGCQLERCKSKWAAFIQASSRVCSLYKSSTALGLAQSRRQLQPQQAPVSASAANRSAQEVAVQLSADEDVVVGVRIAMPAT